MDPVFDAHFHVIQEAFAQQGARLRVAYTPSGDVDYIYEEGRLLVARREDNLPRFIDLVRGAAVVEEHETFVKVAIDNLEDGHLSVPDALDQFDSTFNATVPDRATPFVSAETIVHVERLCSAIEPEVVTGTSQPFPLPRPPAENEQAVPVALVDNGLVKPVDAAAHPWLAGVDGEEDPIGPLLPDGRRHIEAFHGHGTYVAGVLRCQAPLAAVWVGNELSTSGAELESKIAEKIDDVIARQNPAIVNISSGTYTRNNWAPLGFEGFLERHQDTLFVAAAGNDKTDRPLYPAAFPDVLSVGALGPDQVHRAWFSNYGESVDVYAIGEGHINAFTVGEYLYNEPPKRPARQDFTVPLARWDGTSFSAPVVAGMIAARMGRTGESATVAKDNVLAQAQDVAGLGKVLRL